MTAVLLILFLLALLLFVGFPASNARTMDRVARGIAEAREEETK